MASLVVTSRSSRGIAARRFKQHLSIKHFMGNSENTVKTQVWCAVATNVLIAIVRTELQLDASLYTCLHILFDFQPDSSEFAYSFPRKPLSRQNPADVSSELTLADLGMSRLSFNWEQEVRISGARPRAVNSAVPQH
jgi:hypothetical protein